MFEQQNIVLLFALQNAWPLLENGVRGRGSVSHTIIWNQRSLQGDLRSHAQTVDADQGTAGSAASKWTSSVKTDWIRPLMKLLCPKVRGVNKWWARDLRQWRVAIVAKQWAVTSPAVLYRIPRAKEMRIGNVQLIGRSLGYYCHNHTGIILYLALLSSFDLTTFLTVALMCLFWHFAAALLQEKNSARFAFSALIYIKLLVGYL